MNNTIFDDVFRTMIEKMPYLAVPLINEVFHTSYPENVPIVQLRNEHQQENGEIITDSCLKIAGKLYHIECQSVDDTTMAIRMIEYDFSIAIENAQMDIPEAMLMTQCRQMLDDFSRRMQSQGLSMDQYFQFTGMTADKMMEDMKPQALKRIQTRLVLEKVAEVENIQPTEEEVNEEISKMAEAYKMEADKLKEYLGDAEKESIKRDLSVTKAVDLIMENVKERAKAKTKKEKEAEAEENAEENAEE